MSLRSLSVFIAATAAAAAAPALFAASAPPWAAELLDVDTAEWRQNSSAVRLLESEAVRYTANERVRSLRRSVVRVTGERGITAATPLFGYNPDNERVLAARAWIISPDGKQVRPYDRKGFSDTIAQYSSHFWNSHRVLRLMHTSLIGVGSTVAWEFELESQSGIFDSTWSFFSDIPVVRSSFEVTPAPGGKLEWHATNARVPAPTSGAAPGSLRWEMQRLGPLAAELPVGFVPDPLRVSVRCVAPTLPTAQLKSWPALSQAVHELVGPRIDTSPELEARAAALIEGKDDRWARIRALAEFVQGDIAYLSLTIDKDYLAGYRPHRACEVLTNRYGDCKDKATLLVALLRAIGEEGYLVLVYATNPTVVSPEWPSATFNHAIIAFPADDKTPEHWPVVDAPPLGRLVVFDPTNSVAPLGVLPSYDQAGYGLVIAAGGAAGVRLPIESPAATGLDRTIDLQLDATGGLRASVEETRRGSTAADHFASRTALRDDRFARALEQRVHDLIPLARDITWRDEWDRAASRHRLTYRFAAERYARPAGDLLLVTPPVLLGRRQLSPWKATHAGASWQPAERLSETVRIALPDGFVLAETPPPWNQTDAGVYCAMAYEVEGEVVLFRSEAVWPGGLLDEQAYTAVRTSWQKIAEAVRRPLVLRRRAVATAPAP